MQRCKKNKNKQNNKNNRNETSEVKYVPIITDYINGIRDLFFAFGESISLNNCGLINVTRSEDFECGWVCKGTHGISSECYKNFLKSTKINSLIRYSFQ